MIEWMVDRLIDWLIEWVSEWVINWLINWLIDWLIDWLIEWLTFNYCSKNDMPRRTTARKTLAVTFIVLMEVELLQWWHDWNEKYENGLCTRLYFPINGDLGIIHPYLSVSLLDLFLTETVWKSHPIFLSLLTLTLSFSSRPCQFTPILISHG